MIKLKIKNFGPIKEGCQQDDGYIEFRKVIMFLGNQGSGKSTVAKVISTMAWLEKAINRGDVKATALTKPAFLKFLKYQRIHNYLQENSEIEYIGERLSIKYNNELAHLELKWNNGNYIVPKIMYVPAERNVLSVINNATGVKGLPGPLFDFAEELKRGQNEYGGKEIQLPVNNVKFKYDKKSASSFIIGENYNINLLEASSGFQSLVPLFLVSSNIAATVKKGAEINPDSISVDQSIRMNKEISKVLMNDNFTEDEKRRKTISIKEKFQNRCFINIVEEPEQNLYPTSQQQLLYSLLALNNSNPGNRLLITTHSPYLINYLTLAVKADELEDMVKSEDLKDRLDNLVPLHSTVNPKELVIYEFDERKGEIIKLGAYNGIPSDNNSLNMALGRGNQLYDSLLEIEEEL